MEPCADLPERGWGSVSAQGCAQVLCYEPLERESEDSRNLSHGEAASQAQGMTHGGVSMTLTLPLPLTLTFLRAIEQCTYK